MYAVKNKALHLVKPCAQQLTRNARASNGPQAQRNARRFNPAHGSPEDSAIAENGPPRRNPTNRNADECATHTALFCLQAYENAHDAGKPSERAYKPPNLQEELDEMRFGLWSINGQCPRRFSP